MLAVYEHNNEDWQVNNTDATSFLSKLPTESANFCLTDVPYGITRESHDVRLTYEQIKKFAQQLRRVLTTDGGFFSFVNSKQLKDWERGLYSAGFRTMRTGVWLKTNGHSKACPYPSNALEFWIYTTRNNKTDTTLLPIYSSGNTQQLKEHETTVIPFRKPIGLLRTIILNHTELHDVIIDPFCGSGSTGVAALLEDRKPILNDIDSDKIEQIKLNMFAYLSYSVHKPKEAFLAKDDRRGNNDGLTEDQHLDRITTRAKVATGQLPDRRKTVAKKQEAKVEEAAEKTNKKTRGKNKPLSVDQKLKILGVIVEHNYEKKMDWSTYNAKVAAALGRKRPPARDTLVRTSKAIVKQVGKQGDSLLEIPAYQSTDIMKSGLAALIRGKKRIT